MNLNTMLSMLSFKLKDQSKDDFPESLLVETINLAQKQIAGMLHHRYLSELITKVSITPTSGSFTIDDIIEAENAIRLKEVQMEEAISEYGPDVVFIETAEELDAIRDDLTKTYVLLNDIDLSDWGNWDPIGTYTMGDSSTSFSGTFDGKGHSVLNMTVNTENHAGLFGYAPTATIKNVNVVNCSVYSTGMYGTGALVGSGKYVENCSASGNVTAESANAGGLIGITSQYGSIKNCYSLCNVTSGGYAGGFIGDSVQSTFENCYCAGTVSGDDRSAGFCALETAGPSTFTSCYYDSTVSGLSDTDNATPKTTTELKTQSTFSGWDFTDTWEFISEHSYPSLISESVEDIYPLNRINGIKQIQITGDKFLRKITIDQYRVYKNRSYTWNTNYPMWYTVGETIYVLPSDISTVDVYYLKTPPDVAVGATNTNCILSENLHYAIVLMSAHILSDERNNYYEQVKGIIDDINASSAPSDIFDYDLQPEEDPEYYGNEESFTNFLSLYEPE